MLDRSGGNDPHRSGGESLGNHRGRPQDVHDGHRRFPQHPVLGLAGSEGHREGASAIGGHDWAAGAGSRPASSAMRSRKRVLTSPA